VAIFNTSYPSFQTVPNSTNATVGTSAVQIYNTTNFQPVGAGSAIAFPTGGTLRDLTIVNNGAVTCFVGTSSVTATTGVPLAPGQQLTIQGSQAVASSGNTSWNLYAITASGTTTIEASLATVVSVA